MIKFIVLEDNAQFQREIINIIDKLVFKTNYEYKIEKYANYTVQLSRTIKDSTYRKVYILDIALDGSKSGIHVAQEIRREDWDSDIIFVTNHDKMFETVYRSVLKVFDFIEKFHNLSKRLERDLDIILSQKEDYSKFSFENNKIKMQVYLKDIIYIYRDTLERKLVIQTKNNKFLVNMTIKDALKELDARFKQVHRACVVNTERVIKYNWKDGDIVLDTKEKIHFCSKKYKEK